MEQTLGTIEEVGRLADAELIAGLQRWVRADRSATARMLVHLGEVDARRLYRERAWASMFDYVVEELHMSEAEAYLRIAAARLGRRFPRVVELVAEGGLHLTAIKLLAPHLTGDNHLDVLERARGKVTREIELLVAEVAPKPDLPTRVRKLPTSRLADSNGVHLAATRTMSTSSIGVFPGRALSADPALEGVDGGPSQAQSRYIPRSVVREVHARDGGQCTFVSSDGRRCRERGFLELHHHDTPYARGGGPTADNLRIVCRAHNALFAERDFGAAFMQAKLAAARSRRIVPFRHSVCAEGKSDPAVAAGAHSREESSSHARRVVRGARFRAGIHAGEADSGTLTSE